MQVDLRYPPKNIRQFAGQKANIPESQQKILESLFDGKQPAEFYMGLVSGLAAALTIIQAGETHLLTGVLATAADRVEKLEIT